MQAYLEQHVATAIDALPRMQVLYTVSEPKAMGDIYNAVSTSLDRMESKMKRSIELRMLWSIHGLLKMCRENAWLRVLLRHYSSEGVSRCILLQDAKCYSTHAIAESCVPKVVASVPA